MSLDLNLMVQSESKVHISEIAAQFAELDSTRQAVFLQEIFDALEHNCKDAAKFESQLSWISIGIKQYNFNRLKYVFESLSYFLDDKKND